MKLALLERCEGGGKAGKVGFESLVEVIEVDTTEIAGGRLVSSWNGEVYG